MSRVSVNDLLVAADWCEYYEGAPDEEDTREAVHRVGRWLRAEAAKRDEDAFVRAAVQQFGVTPAEARAALRRSKGQ